MATQITIGNKTTSIPGVYSTIKSGIINPPSPVDYGNVVIIDDGSLQVPSYIAINGVQGENKQGLDSALVFNDFAEVQSVLWDSELLPIVKSLYRPSNRQGVSGINKLTIIQAAETTAGTTSIDFTNMTTPLELKTQFEGESLNGKLVPKTYDPLSPTTILSNELGSGLAVRLEVGRAFGYSLVFYRGIHTRSEDPLNPGYGYNEKALTDINQNVPAGTYNIVKPQVLFRSPDVRRLSELKRWMERSSTFKRWFKIESFVIDDLNADNIVAADITLNYTDLAPYSLISGATTTFTPAAFSEALDLTKEIDNTFYLSLASGTDAINSNNTAIFELLTSGQLNWEKYMVVAAFDDQSTFMGDVDTSQAVARYYNSSKVIVVHGSARVSNAEYPEGFRNISTLEKTAKVLGRIAGLPPQTPVTWKDINISGETHKLTESEKEAGIEAGILCTFYDSELTAFVVLAGINSLGDNDFLINDDAQSYSIQVERIKSQLNKELIFGAKRAFFGQNVGPNRNTCSPDDLLTWTKGFLESKVATNERDNLIIRVGAITTRLEQDNMFVDYEFVPNSEISKIIFTGIILSN